jgi:hypothetical protein
MLPFSLLEINTTNFWVLNKQSQLEILKFRILNYRYQAINLQQNFVSVLSSFALLVSKGRGA